MTNGKEVRFDIYCQKCKHQYVVQGDDPCDECLDVPGRYGTEVPFKYEEARKNKRPFRVKNKYYNRNK